MTIRARDVLVPAAAALLAAFAVYQLARFVVAQETVRSVLRRPAAGDGPVTLRRVRLTTGAPLSLSWTDGCVDRSVPASVRVGDEELLLRDYAGAGPMRAPSYDWLRPPGERRALTYVSIGPRAACSRLVGPGAQKGPWAGFEDGAVVDVVACRRDGHLEPCGDGRDALTPDLDALVARRLFDVDGGVSMLAWVLLAMWAGACTAARRLTPTGRVP